MNIKDTGFGWINFSDANPASDGYYEVKNKFTGKKIGKVHFSNLGGWRFAYTSDEENKSDLQWFKD